MFCVCTRSGSPAFSSNYSVEWHVDGEYHECVHIQTYTCINYLQNIVLIIAVKVIRLRETTVISEVYSTMRKKSLTAHISDSIKASFFPLLSLVYVHNLTVHSGFPTFCTSNCIVRFSYFLYQ